MTPRFRRLLIPGLLVALLVVVLVAAISGRADGAEPGEPVDFTEVSRIGDDRITESSGLAVSTKHRGPRLHDQRLRQLGHGVRDPGLDRGRGRHDDRPGPHLQLARHRGPGPARRDAVGGRHRRQLPATHRRGPLRHRRARPRQPHGRPETLSPSRTRTDRRTSRRSRCHPGPDASSCCRSCRRAASSTVCRRSCGRTRRMSPPRRPGTTPGFTSDATYTADGRHVLVRNYAAAEVRDAETWDLIRTDVLPDQQLGETIALEDSERSYLIGSEGLNSTLLRIAFHTDAATPSPTTAPDAPLRRLVEGGDGRVVRHHRTPRRAHRAGCADLVGTSPFSSFVGRPLQRWASCLALSDHCRSPSCSSPCASRPLRWARSRRRSAR